MDFVKMGGFALQLIEVFVAVAASMLIMIMHEFPKAVVFVHSLPKKEHSFYRKKIWRLQCYIDMVGVVMSVVSFAGFSKPLMYRVSNPKTNISMGSCGFVSLLLAFVGSVCRLRQKYELSYLAINDIGIKSVVGQLFWIYMAILSVSMFLVNLFPVSVFDMGLIIAGSSAHGYLNIVKSDSFIKCILILAILFGVVRHFSFMLVNTCLGL